MFEFPNDFHEVVYGDKKFVIIEKNSERDIERNRIKYRRILRKRLWNLISFVFDSKKTKLSN